MGLTRRQVLAATAAMGGAVAVGAAGTVGRWWDTAPDAELQVLSRDEYDFVQAAAEAWMPPGGDPAISGAEAGVGRFFDDFLVTIPAQQRTLLKLLLQALDERTVPLHLSTFKNLDLETRSEVLDGWVESSIYVERQAAAALMALMSFGYTLHPDVSKFFSPMFGCGYAR